MRGVGKEGQRERNKRNVWKMREGGMREGK